MQASVPFPVSLPSKQKQNTNGLAIASLARGRFGRSDEEKGEKMRCKG